MQRRVTAKKATSEKLGNEARIFRYKKENHGNVSPLIPENLIAIVPAHPITKLINTFDWLEIVLVTTQIMRNLGKIHSNLSLRFLWRWFTNKNFNAVSPRPLRPTNLKSLNFATWFFITVVQFLSSPQKFSSLPHMRWQGVPSWTSPSATTLNATGRVLLDRQWVGSVEQTMWGEPVRVSSPGCSAINESIVRSAKFSAVNGDSRPELTVAEPPFVELAEEFRWLLAPEFPFCSGGAVVDVTSDAMCIFIPLFFGFQQFHKNIFSFKIPMKYFQKFITFRATESQSLHTEPHWIWIHHEKSHPSVRDHFKNVSVTAKTFPWLTHFDRWCFVAWENVE